MKKKLPSPFVFYYYRHNDWMGEDDWMGVVWSEKDGWVFCLRDPGGNLRRMSQYWPSKVKALELMQQSAVELSGSECSHLFKTIYKYPTSPPIVVFRDGSRWRWQCGGEKGSQSQKNKALHAAQYALENPSPEGT
jgi:hypothetical protein